MAENVIPEYLDLLDAQRKAVFAALDGLSEEQIWQRPAPKEWCIGEILSHTVRFLDSFHARATVHVEVLWLVRPPAAETPLCGRDRERLQTPQLSDVDRVPVDAAAQSGEACAPGRAQSGGRICPTARCGHSTPARIQMCWATSMLTTLPSAWSI